MSGLKGKNWASDPANAERVRANSAKAREVARNCSEFDKALKSYKAKKYAGRKKKHPLWSWENA